jgi:hypothetical protein
LGSSGLELGSVASSCEHCNEHSDSIEGGEYPDSLSVDRGADGKIDRAKLMGVNFSSRHAYEMITFEIQTDPTLHLENGDSFQKNPCLNTLN